MKRFFSLKFLLGLLLAAGAVAIASIFLNDDTPESDTAYGEPDNETAGEDIASFVD